MIKIFAILMFVLFSNFSFGQSIEIEKFINQVCQQIVPANYEYYNLVDSSFITEFDKYPLEKDDLIKLLKDYPDLPINLLSQKVNEQKILFWKSYHLDRAKVYSIKSIPKFPQQIKISRIVPYNTSKQTLDSLQKTKKYDEVIVPIKSWWSKKRRDKEIKNAWTKYSNSIKAEDKIYYSFSTPIFSDNSMYAIVTLNQSGRGATYIFKKLENKWTEIFILNRWIS